MIYTYELEFGNRFRYNTQIIRKTKTWINFLDKLQILYIIGSYQESMTHENGRIICKSSI